MSEIYTDVFIFHTQEWSLSLRSLFLLLERSLSLFCYYNKNSVTFFYGQGLIERLSFFTLRNEHSKVLFGQILIVVGTYVRDKGLISHWRRGISFLSVLSVGVHISVLKIIFPPMFSNVHFFLLFFFNKCNPFKYIFPLNSFIKSLFLSPLMLWWTSHHRLTKLLAFFTIASEHHQSNVACCRGFIFFLVLPVKE